MMQAQPYVQSCPVPAAARVTNLYERDDLSDAYSIALPPGTVHDPERLARWMFEQPAPWVKRLMGLRDTLVAGFGLKTARGMQSGSAPHAGKRIGIFRIYFQDAHEIVLGEDDRHLDFRISVLLQLSAAHPAQDATLVVSSVVHCHNRLGHAYLTVIAPFHRLIVQATLRRAARRGWPTEASESMPA